jgi:hypothetical protein
MVGMLMSWLAGGATVVHAQTIHVSLQSDAIEGKPVFWDDRLIAILGRDGQLVTFAPSEAREFRKISDRFQSHSQSTLRGELLREFGNGYDVSGTGQFLVVHPAGQRDRWAERFQELYRAMQHYLGARGFRREQPEFPFIAVVFPTQQHYMAYSHQQGTRVGMGTLGHYDPNTNRILMFDVTANQPNSTQWHVNAETIIHEAAHQTAFNVGVHSRLTTNPRWVVEGLGTMFEAPGVWDARNHPLIQDRVIDAQRALFLRAVNGQNSLDMMAAQVSSDDLFRASINVAYAHAWALTFYLTEKQPRQYAEYLERIRRRPQFGEYPRDERLKDFVAVFGNDLRMLDARVQRFIAELP